MLQPWLFVGFTGHRKISDPALAAAAIRDALQKIREHSRRPLAAVSSAASGGDTLFAEAVIEQNLPWTALLPFAREEFRQDFTAEEWKLTERLLSFAIQETVEPPGAERKDAFLACGVRTVENCDVLIALWDGAEASGKGGTGDVVEYARDQQKPLVWIQANTGIIVEERTDTLRRLEVAAPDQPQPDESVEGGLAELKATMDYHDNQATVHSPKARSLLTRAITLQITATGMGLAEHFLHELSAVLAVAIQVIGVLIIAKIGILIYAQIVQRRQGSAQDRWMRDRMIAELCRSSVATWFLPFGENVHQPLPVPEYGGWQRSLRLWRLRAPPRPRGLTADKADYLANRIRDQRDYFTKKCAAAARSLAKGQRAAAICTGIAIICGVYGLTEFLLRLPGEHSLASQVVQFFDLLLPLVSAAILHHLIAQDYTRRVARHQRMMAYLRWAEQRVEIAVSPAELGRVAGEIETMLLLEVFEWHSTAQIAKEIRA